jgi:GDPmannose 4,6-dehydratase
VRALVIGATGQDGSYICETLAKMGVEVFGITRNPKKFVLSEKELGQRESGPHLSHVEMSDTETAHKFLDELTPDLIFHVAAVHENSIGMESLQQRSEIEMKKCHVTITENVLRWQQKNIESKSVFALSSKIYRLDPRKDRTINEQSSVDPTDAYGSTKAEAWQIIKKYRNDYGLKCSAAILFNHSSPMSKPQFLLPTLRAEISNYMREKTSHITVVNKLSRVSFLHAEEVAALMVKMCCDSKGQDLVIGSPIFMSIEELVEKTLSKFEVAFDKYTIQSSADAKPGSILIPNTSLASSIHSWKPSSTSLSILEEMINSPKINNATS